jgi:hypothetical protein
MSASGRNTSINLPVRPVQSSKAYFSMLVTLFGMVRLVRVPKFPNLRVSFQPSQAKYLLHKELALLFRYAKIRGFDE